MEQKKIMLLCSGYGAETGSDLLAVKLFENTETGEVHTEITGGIRQGDSPSFSLLHGGFLYTVAELVGEKHAYIYQYRLSEDGIPVPTGKRFSFRVENCAICMPGKRHCMRAAMEPGISLQWIMISKNPLASQSGCWRDRCTDRKNLPARTLGQRAG